MRRLSGFFLFLILIDFASCKKDIEIRKPQVQSSTQTTFTIPNNDFEIWKVLGSNANPAWLTSWITDSNPLGLGPALSYIIQPDSTNVYHGKYSVKLIYNHTEVTAWAKTQFAIAAHPSSLHGYVKCDLSGTDTVAISIKLLKQGIVVDSGQWISTVPINIWSGITIPISHQNSVVDSALIIMKGGRFRPTSTTTVLWVDDLSLY